DATHKLTLGNDLIQFAARFGGVSRECSIPMSAVRGIFARENGEGMFFQAQPAQPAEPAAAPEPARDSSAAGSSAPTPPSSPAPGGSNGRKSHLQVVK